MGEVGKSVRAGNRASPGLHSRTCDLLGGAAFSADQVMMVRATAAAIDTLPAVSQKGVNCAPGRHCLKGAVDRGQADLLSPGCQEGMDVLGTTEVIKLIKGRGDGTPLSGRAC